MSDVVAMAMFALSMSLTPGPVNVLTFSNGVNYGFRASLPFVSGATIGFTGLLAAIGFGIAGLLQIFPEFTRILGVAGSLFLIYLGYRIASAGGERVNAQKEASSGFMSGAILQWINPKAWTACIAGISAFNLSNGTGKLLLFISIYFFICYASIAVWAWTGHKVRHLVNSGNLLKKLNLIMGSGLILLSLSLLLSQ